MPNKGATEGGASPQGEAKSEKRLIERLADALGSKKVDGAGAGFDEVVWAEKLQRNHLPPVRCVGREWFGYEEGRWGTMDRAAFGPASLRSLPRKHKTARKAASLLDHVEMACQVTPVDLCGFYKEKLDENGERSFLLNARNGVVRVFPEEGGLALEKHAEAHGFTLRAAAAFDPKARCDRFLEVLAEQLPDPEDQELMQCFGGNILWPTPQFEAALISYGREGIGKSKLALAMASALQDKGDDGDLISNLSMTQICNSTSYSLPKLRFAALNLGTEVQAVDLDESSNFKQLVSGERLEVRGIYSRPIAMQSNCKLWFLANDLPRFKNGSGAELRRMRFLKFDVEPAKRDTRLLDKLVAERDGIFHWMLQGVLKLMALGAVPLGGKESRAVRDKFEMSNDSVGWFVKHKCVLGPAEEIKKGWLLQEFEDFLAENGLPKKHAEDWFFRKLYLKYATVKPVRRREAGETLPYVTGLRLRMEGEG